jgi:adenylyl-sulfate kinase
MKRALVLWFTGLSGSGKSTVTGLVRDRLAADGVSLHVLDGDEVRALHQPPLGFSPADIRLNNSLIAARCAELRGSCDVILVPVISPFADARAEARRRLAPGFYEVYCDADVATAARRDVKGLYAKAARGEIPDMIGFSAASPYEAPARPDFVVRSGAGGEAPEASAERLAAFVRERLAEVRA